MAQRSRWWPRRRCCTWRSSGRSSTACWAPPRFRSSSNASLTGTAASGPPARGGGEPSPDFLSPAGGPRCVESIAGVPLGTSSLVAEPGYLENRQQFDAYFRDRAALYGALEGRAETTLALRDEGGQRTEATVPVARARVTRGWFDLLIGVVAALTFLAIGCLALLTGPARPMSRPMFLFSTGFAFGLTVTGANAAIEVTVVPWLETSLFWINIAGVCIGGSALADLLGRFQTSPLRPGAVRALRLALYAVPLAAYGADLAGLTFGASLVAFLACLAVAGVLVIRAYVVAHGQVQRLQIRWVLWGFAIPIVAALVLRAPILLLGNQGEDPTDTALTLFCIAFPASFYVSITRHRLLDLRLMTQRAIVGGSVIALIVVGALLATAQGGETLQRGAIYPSVFVAVVLTATVFTFLWPPVQRALADALDRLVFRRARARREDLQTLPRDLGRVHTAEEASRLVLDRVADALVLDRMVIALAPHAEREGVWTRGDVTAPAGGAFWSAAARIGPFELLDVARADDDPVAGWMRDQGLAIAIPLGAGDEFLGIVVCGPPGGDGLYERRQVDPLETAAASLATTLRQKLALATIERMNRELEARVDERTAELDAARLQLVQAEKMRTVGQLAAGLAHELNTPLGIVSSACQRLTESLGEPGEDGASPESRRLAAFCQAAAADAAEIVGSLEDFSRPGQDGTGVIDLRASVETTLSVLGPSIRGAEIETDLQLPDLPEVECVPAQIHQVLMNVVVNAIQAMEDGGVLTVQTGEGENGTVWLAVADSGPGIAEDIRSRVFEPFFTTREPGQGAGLGLSLSYGIVRNHGGNIYLDPKVPRGARVVVELPVSATPSRSAALR